MSHRHSQPHSQGRNSELSSNSSHLSQQSSLQAPNSEATTCMNYGQAQNPKSSSEANSGQPLKSINSYGSQKCQVKSLQESNSSHGHITEHNPRGSDNNSDEAQEPQIDRGKSKKEPKEKPSYISNIVPFNDDNQIKKLEQSPSLNPNNKKKSTQVKPELPPNHPNEPTQRSSNPSGSGNVSKQQCADCKAMECKMERLQKKLDALMNHLLSQKSISSSGSSRKSKKTDGSKKDSQKSSQKSQSYIEQSEKTIQTSSLLLERGQNPEDLFKKQKKKNQSNEFEGQTSQRNQLFFTGRGNQKTMVQSSQLSQSLINITKKQLLKETENPLSKRQVKPVPFDNRAKQTKKNQRRDPNLEYEKQQSKGQGDMRHSCVTGATQEDERQRIPPQSKKQKFLNKPNGDILKKAPAIIASTTSIVEKGMRKEKVDKQVAQEFDFLKNCCGVFPAKR